LWIGFVLPQVSKIQSREGIINPILSELERIECNRIIHEIKEVILYRLCLLHANPNGHVARSPRQWFAPDEIVNVCLDRVAMEMWM
jgi:hypothetical protein